MKFDRLADYFQRLEKTSLRNEMTRILSELFKETKEEEIDKICYLTQGRVAPLFEALEFGVADKIVIRGIAQGLGLRTSEVKEVFGKKGDLGNTAEELRQKPSLNLFSKENLKKGKDSEVTEVFEILVKLAKAGGEGSQETKINFLADLVSRLSPLSVRYVIRIVLAKLRLGFSDMTVLDSLSFMIVGDKSLRPIIEKAYNVRPDLGFLASEVKKGKTKEGVIKELEKVEPEVGVPILMAKAERLSSGEEIIEKIGRCALEPKIDGFRLQIHKNGQEVHLFSRNLEDVTFMYPDITRAVLKQIKPERAIFEGEAIAYDIKTGQYLPFQETVQRKRKYDIEKMAQKIPLRLIIFECLFVNGENLIGKSLKERRKKLEEILKKGETVLTSEFREAGKASEIEIFFEDAISRGLEGIMAKRLEGVYQAGARSWNWIKYKRSYSGKLKDTIDAIVMGYDFGQGKRVSFGIGDFLIGVYDLKKDVFETIAKIGTGLTDIEWKTLRKKCDQIRSKNKPARFNVDKLMTCDIWVEPQIVVEIKADEISRSPVHTAGFALRFPRLVRFRDDKSPEAATTLKEIVAMFEKQGERK